MKSRWKPVAVSATLVMVAAAACSSSSGGSKQAGGSSTVRGVTDTSITVGGVAALTSAQGAVFTGVDVGAKARFAQINAAGGINGRKIKFLGVTDDGTDPAKDATAVKDLVLSKKVFAVVPLDTIVLTPQTADFLAQQKVPFMGWGVTAGYCGNDYGFGFNGCLLGSDYYNAGVLGPQAKLLHPGATIAIAEGDNASGQAALKQLPAVANSLGLKLVYVKASIPDAPSTNWSALARQLMTSNHGGPPDAIDADGLLPQAAGLAAALKAANYKGLIINYTTYIPGQMPPNLAQAINGVYTNIQFGPQEQGGPAIDKMLQGLASIGAPQKISLGVAIGYWAADMLGNMLQAVGRNLTPDTFAAKINGGYTYTPSPAGAMGPITWPLGHTAPAPCSAMVQAQGTSYRAAVPFACYKLIKAS